MADFDIQPDDSQDERQRLLGPIAAPNAVPVRPAAQTAPLVAPPTAAAPTDASPIEPKPVVAPPVAAPTSTAPVAAAPVQQAPIAKVAPPQPHEGFLENLYNRESNIKNPLLRTLAKVGTGIARGAEGIASPFVPELSFVPGTELNAIAQNRRDAAAQAEAAKEKVAQENAESERVRAENPPEVATIRAQADADAAAERAKEATQIQTQKGQQAEDLQSKKGEQATTLQTQKGKQAEGLETSKEQNQKDIEASREATQKQIAAAHNEVLKEVASIRQASADDPNKLAPQVKKQAQTAVTILPQVDNLEAETRKMADELGPVKGRWNEFMIGKVGAPNADFAHYMDEMVYMQSAVTLAHSQGRVSNLVYDEFKKMFDAGRQSPENMIAALEATRDWMQRYADLLKPQANAGGGNGKVSRFTVNGKTYNIPADKVGQFKKQFPKAQQQ